MYLRVSHVKRQSRFPPASFSSSSPASASLFHVRVRALSQRAGGVGSEPVAWWPRKPLPFGLVSIKGLRLHRKPYGNLYHISLDHCPVLRTLRSANLAHTHTHTHSARSSFLKSIHTLSRCHSPTSRRRTLMNEYRYLQTGKAAAAAEALAARTYARTYKCVRACACVRVRARACARIHASHITVMPVAIMPTSLAKLSPLGMVSCGCVYITSARKRQRRTQGARAAAREGGCAAPRFRPHTS